MRITRIRILITDDNAAVRKALRAHLEPRPELEVAAEATNGRQAVERTLQILPHVVLLDIAILNWTVSVRPGRYDRRPRKCNC